MTTPQYRHVSVCICTYKRPQMLERLLVACSDLRTEGLFTYSVVVVDNDCEEQGREVVDKVREFSRIAIAYDVESRRSISHARNACVALSNGDLVAFIDDDEVPDEWWLVRHFEVITSMDVDGVLGPVIPRFDGCGPRWLMESDLLERRRFQTGHVIQESRYTRTGNVLLRKSLFAEVDDRFDPRYGLSGGGDGVFFFRMIAKGKVFVWCDEALVFETVPKERQRRTYYLKRALTRGMTEAWERPFFSEGTVRSLLAVVAYSLVLPFAALGGGHVVMSYLVRTCDHLGKLLAYVGIHIAPQRPY